MVPSPLKQYGAGLNVHSRKTIIKSRILFLVGGGYTGYGFCRNYILQVNGK
jgi:hypothetical protein